MTSAFRSAGVLATTTLLACCLACGATGDETAGAEKEVSMRPTSTIAAAAPGDTSFGALPEVCGPGDAKVAPGQQGLDNGRFNRGVGADRSSTIQPGLNKEMWDASVAFADWCNARGGIKGLRINLVELSASLFEVESAMATACRDVFALVGGGMAQDNLQFSGKDGTDFHRCGLVDVPGFAVSAQKTLSSGQVQPLPNPATSIPTTWMRDFRRLYPTQAKKVAVAYADVPSVVATKDKYLAGLRDVGMEVVDTPSYPPIGQVDWLPLARRIIDSGATSLLVVGQPGDAARLLTSVRDQGWTGVPLLETNMYDPTLFSAGTSGPEGAVIRVVGHPLEEADRWPAVRQYLDNLRAAVPDAKVGGLGIQATSAWLLFATAANACVTANGGTLDRTCMLEQAAAAKDWTGGGLHAPTDPERFDRARVTGCGMLLVVKGGKFQRLFPKVGSPEDDGDGFHCPSDGVTDIPVNRGKGVVDPDRPM